jgi:hypothetical protein
MSESYLQLAAQIPSQWLRSVETKSSAELAIRKIVFRALISPNLRGTSIRLGKLRDDACRDFSTFLRAASEKVGSDLSYLEHTTENIQDGLSQRLEVLQTLRCMVGPAIESLIIIDRLIWLHERLDPSFDARAVNLFDIGRNVAIVVSPHESFP